MGLRGASLEEFAGNGWFFGGEADVRVLRGASLLGTGCFGRNVLGEALLVGLRKASQDGINGTSCEWGEMLLDCSTAF